MPISQINPDGSVKIYNTKTKQVLDVKPDQLVNYSPKLLTDYNSMVQKNAEDKQKLTGKTPAATQKDVNMGKSGLRSLQTVADEYQKDPDVLTKQLLPGKLLTRKFDSALFNTVDTILRARTGAQANKEEIASYLNEKGPTFGDSPEVVQYKLNAIQQDLADAAGVSNTKPITFNAKGQPAKQGGFSVGGLLQNAKQDTGNILNGVLNIPSQVGQNVQGAYSQDPQQRMASAAALNPTNVLGQLGLGVANEANQALGEPLKGGDILGRIMSRAYEKPVTTALDLLPLKGLKGAKGAKAAEVTGVAGKTGLAERTFVSQFGLTPRIGERLKPLQVAKEILDDGTVGSFSKMKDTAAAITGKDGILSKTVRDSLGKVKQDIPIPTGGAESVFKNTSAVSEAEAAKELSNIRRITAGDRMAGSGKLPGNTNVSEAFDAARDLQKEAAFWNGKDTSFTPNPKAAKIAEAYSTAADDLLTEVEKAAKAEGVVIAKDPAVTAKLKKISPNLAKKYENAQSIADLRKIQAPYVKLSQMIDITENNVASKTGPLLGQQAAGLTGAGIGGITGGPLGAVLGYGAGQAAQPLINTASQAIARPMINAASKLYRGGLSLPKIQFPSISPTLLKILQLQGQQQ